MMSLGKPQLFCTLAALAAGCASPFVVGVEGGNGEPDDMGVVETRDLGGRDFSTNIPCDLGAGFHVCNGSCIAPTTCCTGNDCPSPPTGQALCQMGMCVLSCNPGYKMCNTNCIPNGLCCTDSDCAATAHVAKSACNQADGTCHITTCATGYYDLDGTFNDGCECADQNKARQCAGATSLGTVPIGGMFTAQGNLPGAGVENWFSVNFQSNTSTSYHPKVTLSTNPSSAFKFDVLTSCALSSTEQCGETASQKSTGDTTWEMSYTGGDPTGGGGVCPSNTGNCSTPFVAIAPVGPGGTVSIRVYRTGPTVSCDTYTLTISN
jgi:hypothetical protein